MTIIIKRSAGKEKLEQLLRSLQKTGKLDAYKYCGTISLEKSPVEIQKQLRDEWS